MSVGSCELHYAGKTSFYSAIGHNAEDVVFIKLTMNILMDAISSCLQIVMYDIFLKHSSCRSAFALIVSPFNDVVFL